jgi:hypothetical protein
MTTRNAMLAVVAGTLAGIAATLVAGSEPGFPLGFFITLGAIIGVLGVRRRSIYLFFPLPPFAFFVGGLVTGKVHDSSISSTTLGLFASLPQWTADIFFPMCVATILVLIVGGIRWGLGLMLVDGQFSMSDGRPGGPRGPRPRPAPGPRADVDPWADPNTRTRRQPAADVPRADDQRVANGRSERRPGNAPRLGPNGARPATPPRSPRDPRGDSDPWGDPRPGTERRPQARNPPPAAPRPSAQPTFRPRGAEPVPPRDRAPRPPVPPRPARPPRDQWDQR